MKRFAMPNRVHMSGGIIYAILTKPALVGAVVTVHLAGEGRQVCLTWDAGESAEGYWYTCRPMGWSAEELLQIPDREAGPATGGEGVLW